ncbi:hypothetical protein J6590_094688 [Homalodisca vitripennis]|nr:hypothetical protein J6590_094688 [Homalodisca vitripennis]
MVFRHFKIQLSNNALHGRIFSNTAQNTFGRQVSCGVWIEVENNEEVTVEIKAQLWFTRNILSGPLENGVDQTFSPRVREPYRYDVMAHLFYPALNIYRRYP